MEMIYVETFLCTKCGLCCQHVDMVDELAEYNRGDGRCKFLADNLCSIYEKRPLICRVKEMYEAKYRQEFDWSTFCQLNHIMCIKLQANQDIG
ncbi:hypothetical protein SPSIL_052410 [Sporomusa silvacetica DSM 10669]|uniref:Flagellin N-methylase n=2 Tax=Sporomusa silvacetica TaxID=55504 RepID=A0ABZ3IUG4_9FIRM|nr:YkgJ family cysteine cluster protein [Sporomusa silvacetica]OZC19668.1 flagellin N-methylase [Sporomusa silvacetica DSM 10669]